jgi:hypothetical protein
MYNSLINSDLKMSNDAYPLDMAVPHPKPSVQYMETPV